MDNPNDLISRAAAINWFFRPYSNEESYSNLDVERALKAIPAVDAIPVKWLETQIRSYTGDVSDIGKGARNGTIKDLIRKWQKEQEAQDG